MRRLLLWTSLVIGALLRELVWLHVMLLALNVLVPAYPLDGARALVALLSR